MDATKVETTPIIIVLFWSHQRGKSIFLREKKPHQRREQHESWLDISKLKWSLGYTRDMFHGPGDCMSSVSCPLKVLCLHLKWIGSLNL